MFADFDFDYVYVTFTGWITRTGYAHRVTFVTHTRLNVVTPRIGYVCVDYGCCGRCCAVTPVTFTGCLILRSFTHALVYVCWFAVCVTLRLIARLLVICVVGLPRCALRAFVYVGYTHR